MSLARYLSKLGARLSSDGKVPTTALGAGAVLQVVNAYYSTSTSNSTTNPADTGLTATITPTSSTSKILVVVNQNGVSKNTTTTSVFVTLLRNGAEITSSGWARYASDNGTTNTNPTGVSLTLLDSPATTSALIYKTQFWSSAGTAAAVVQYGGTTSYITLLEIAA